jgi:hypothetical protein
MSTGDIHLHFLRKPRQRLDDPLRPAPLLPLLRLFTEGALDLANRITEAIVAERGHTPSRTHVINGVYIPALHHLLSYEEPNRKMTEDEKRRRKIKARYLWTAGDYLNSVDLGHPDGFWLPFAVRMEELFSTRPRHMTKPKHPEYRDGEALFDWQLYFEKMEQRYVVLLRDGIYYSPEGLEQAKNALQVFRQNNGEASVVLVSDATQTPQEIPVEQIFDGLILDTNPVRAAERAFEALMNFGNSAG